MTERRARNSKSVSAKSSPSEPPTADLTPDADLPLTMNRPTLAPGAEATALGGRLITLPCTFGRYQLLRQLGQGGMGTVYLAHDPVLERRIAIKVPNPEVLRSPHALERFNREAQSAARLNHRNICQIYDVGCFEEQHFLTMAFIEGAALSGKIPELIDQPRQIAELVRTLALALEEAHQHGIIHRDLKPANIMMDRRDQPVIMDFGLARRVEATDGTRTSQGVILGTPAYMPPEQALGDTAAAGPASDVYSLGVILYEMLCGRLPFEGHPTAILVKVIHEDPPPPSAHRPGVDPRLEAVCHKAMAKQPKDRFASMAQFAATLDDYLTGRSLQIPAAAPTTPAGRLFDSILREFRRWGWERGLKRVREWLPTSRELPEADNAHVMKWLEGDREIQESLLEKYHDEGLLTSLTAWVLTGRAWTSLKQFQPARAKHEIEQALQVPRPLDRVLDGILAYMQGFILSRAGQWEESIPELDLALEHLGLDHFLTGTVLDTLGRVYTGKCNLLAGCEFYHQALACKQRVGDDAGMVLTYEEIGRTYIEWEQFDLAEAELEAGLLVAERLGDEGKQARVLNHLGRVSLYRGEHEAALGKQAAAKKFYKQAAEYLDWAVNTYQRLGQAVPEGRARKYVGLTRLHDGKLDEAEQHLQRGLTLLTEAGHQQGVAETQRFFARLRMAQNRIDEAMQLLRQALQQFDKLHLPIDATRTQFDLAQAMIEAKAPGRLIVRALQDALLRAEDCRRGELVERIEEALKAIDEEAHARHIFRRVRGSGAPDNTSSLCSGNSEPLSVLSLELVGFENFCQGLDPEEVMNTLNQVLAELQIVLDRHRATVMSYLGGGFLATVRDTGHAERAVQTALDLLERMTEFNRPRQILQLPLLPARIGVTSGFVFSGNIGTYRHLSYAAVGPPVNLASSLMRRATMTGPLIAKETVELIGDRFLFSADSPRTVDITGMGKRQVWEVVGRAAQAPSSLRR